MVSLTHLILNRAVEHPFTFVNCLQKAMQADPSIGKVDLAPMEMTMNHDKLRFNAKKIAEYSKQNAKQAMRLNERAGDILTATSTFNSS